MLLFFPSSLSDPRFVNLGAGQGQRIMVLRDYGSYFVNGYSNIIRGDIRCSNGVVHVMGSMIWPSISSSSDVARTLKCTAFLDQVVANYMKSLVDAAGATVFLPTNEAMATFPDHDQKKVIGYHILKSLYYLSDFTDGGQIKTSNNEMITMVRDDRRLKVLGANGEASVLTTNYNEAFSRNGVVYRIDKVLLSPSFIDPSIAVAPTDPPGGPASPSKSAASDIDATIVSLVVVLFSVASYLFHSE